MQDCSFEVLDCLDWNWFLNVLGLSDWELLEIKWELFLISICTNFVRIFLNALLRVYYLDLYEFFWTWTLYYVYVISICTNSICTTFLGNALVVQTEGLLYIDWKGKSLDFNEDFGELGILQSCISVEFLEDKTWSSRSLISFSFSSFCSPLCSFPSSSVLWSFSSSLRRTARSLRRAEKSRL